MSAGNEQVKCYTLSVSEVLWTFGAGGGVGGTKHCIPDQNKDVFLLLRELLGVG